MSGQHRTRTPWGAVSAALVALVALAGLLGIGLASAAPSGTTFALVAKNASGVNGTATITGSKVVATADGLDPSRVYLSYVYGAGSSASGNNPCVLTGERAAGPIDTVGRWSVDSHGHGTLTGTLTLPQLAPGTMSIRRNDSGLRGLDGPTPLDPLVACGQVGQRQTTPAGQVQDQLPAVKLPPTPALNGK